MKVYFIFLLFLLSGCALWDEMFGRPKPIKVSSAHDQHQVVPDEVKIIDEIRIKSSDNKATLSILKLSDKNAFVSIYLAEDKVNYKEGHSIEITIDHEKMIHPLERTVQPDVIRFLEPMDLLAKLKGKPSLEVEIITKYNDKRIFLFNVL